ncbi:SAM-dependent methyltransferase [Filimonas lacunae]|nr:cyclopropane-fatty-acyl-phospholipid synthase family protein [Filimonas lacunae]
MNKGRLYITMPSGETITLGNGEGGVTASISIVHKNFFKRCVLYGDIGFGEAYEVGEWNTDNITHVLQWFLLNIDHAPSVSGSHVKSVLLNGLKIWNRLLHSRRGNSIIGSKKNIAAHYDLNNDFFALFLDKTMTYSSAYFYKEGMSLEEGQYAKYDRLCRQLHLQPADHVLEIGSGWGGNAIYIAKHYGCRVTTVTISEEQHRYAVEKIKEAGLEDRIEVLLQDYRYIKGSFDKIVSIEMIEAVGAEYLEEYCKTCYALLKRNGILAIQAITCPDSRFDQLRNGVDWIQKHIFPGSLLPSIGAINKAMNNTGDLTLVDVKDMGLDYAATLAIWCDRFNKQLQQVRLLGFSDSFVRKWNYYFSYCEAAFAMRNINVMQLVYVRPNTLTR